MSLQPARTTENARLRVLAVDHTAGDAGGEVALARLLHAVDRERYELSALLLEDGPLAARLQADGVRVAVLAAPAGLVRVGRGEAASSPVALAGSAVRTIALVPRLAAAIRGAHVDLVIANSLKSAVLVALAAPLAGRPWVWHLHDRIAPDYLPGVMVTALRWLARLGPRAVVANSRATRQTLPGLADERIVVAYPGLQITATVDVTTARERTSGVVFGLLGRIAPTKGQPEFLRAAALAAAALPEARFRVIGDAMFNDAAFAEEVRALPAELGIADRVAFPGWVTDPSAELAGLSALVHASPVPEPFGQVVVEAMLAGIPVIATDAGGVPEILDPSGDAVGIAPGVAASPLGLLVQPGDVRALASAMTWLAQNPDAVQAMATAARHSAAGRFDISTIAPGVQSTWTHAARAASPRLGAIGAASPRR